MVMEMVLAPEPTLLVDSGPGTVPFGNTSSSNPSGHSVHVVQLSPFTDSKTEDKGMQTLRGKPRFEPRQSGPAAHAQPGVSRTVQAARGQCKGWAVWG